MNLVHRHQALRRRRVVQTPGRSRALLRVVDALAYIVSFCSLFFTLDQVRIIWVQHDAGGVSLVTWGFYVISATAWLLYGLIHKEKVIIITNILWICMNFSVALGIFIYR